jgi:hypothetical protein
VIVTFQPERVMSALGPIEMEETSPPTQPAQYSQPAQHAGQDQPTPSIRRKPIRNES